MANNPTGTKMGAGHEESANVEQSRQGCVGFEIQNRAKGGQIFFVERNKNDRILKQFGIDRAIAHNF